MLNANSDISNVAAVGILSEVASPDVGYDMQTQHNDIVKLSIALFSRYISTCPSLPLLRSQVE